MSAVKIADVPRIYIAARKAGWSAVAANDLDAMIERLERRGLVGRTEAEQLDFIFAQMILKGCLDADLMRALCERIPFACDIMGRAVGVYDGRELAYWLPRAQIPFTEFAAREFAREVIQSLFPDRDRT